MSKLPTGKTLLRNVIRHRDAHNKIQEEMEMWKMRDWETQTSQHKHLPATECVRGRMHCDRMPDYCRDVDQNRERVSDDREDRSCTRRLYEFEASDPDRWGHSGFKELYPEVFESDGDEAGATKKSGRHKMKKSKSGTETRLSKHSKKSRKKKKKKKKDDEKQKKAECSSGDDEGGGGGADRRRRKVSKSRHKSKKTPKCRERREESSDDHEEEDGRTRTPKKRKLDSNRDSCLESHKKKKRKNWKTEGEEKSDGSSGD